MVDAVIASATDATETNMSNHELISAFLSKAILSNHITLGATDSTNHYYDNDSYADIASVEIACGTNILTSTVLTRSGESELNVLLEPKSLVKFVDENSG